MQLRVSGRLVHLKLLPFRALNACHPTAGFYQHSVLPGALPRAHDASHTSTWLIHLPFFCYRVRARSLATLADVLAVPGYPDVPALPGLFARLFAFAAHAFRLCP